MEPRDQVDRQDQRVVLVHLVLRGLEVRVLQALADRQDQLGQVQQGLQGQADQADLREPNIPGRVLGQ